MTAPKSPAFRSIFSKLADKKLITPYLDLAVTQGNWPLKYTITIDSSPYYGIDADTGEPDGFFHPSSHGKLYAFPRLLWYMLHPEYRDQIEKEPPSLQREMTFAMGSSLHGVVQTQFTMLKMCRCSCVPGETHTCGDIEVEYTGPHNERGRLDFIVNHPTEGRIPVEMKTMNAMSFAKIDSTVESMKLEWKIQLSMALDNLGYSWGILLVMQAGWPYRFEEIRFNRDDALLSQVYEGFETAAEGLALDSPPERCCAYNSKTMKSCPARHVCWLADQRKVS